MAEGVQSGLIQAAQVVRETAVLRAPNGVNYARFGDASMSASDLERLVQVVPNAVAGALTRKTYYFVPLALSEGRASEAGNADPRGSEPAMIAREYTPELGDQAICHRNVTVDGVEGVFLSTRLLGDRFALAFEFFINVGHAFVDATGVPEGFNDLVWAQAVADVRGETSQDAWESRNLALPGGPSFRKDARPESRRQDGRPFNARPGGGATSASTSTSTPAPTSTSTDEKAKSNFLESAFSDALAIYQLSLSVDFDYSELREREYPLLAPQALAERLRMIARLFPPNPGYDFAIRYRRRA